MNTQNENGHMLLFSGKEWYKELSHDEIQNVISQTKAWFDRLNGQGKIKGGQPLARTAAGHRRCDIPCLGPAGSG